MRLPCSGRTDKGKVAVRVDRRKRWQGTQLVDIPALDEREVKVLEGLEILEGKTAEPQYRLDRGLRLLFTQVFKDMADGFELALVIVFLLGYAGKLCR